MYEFARSLFPEAEPTTTPTSTQMTKPADDKESFASWALAHSETYGT